MVIQHRIVHYHATIDRVTEIEYPPRNLHGVGGSPIVVFGIDRFLPQVLDASSYTCEVALPNLGGGIRRQGESLGAARNRHIRYEPQIGSVLSAGAAHVDGRNITGSLPNTRKGGLGDLPQSSSRNDCGYKMRRGNSGVIKARRKRARSVSTIATR